MKKTKLWIALCVLAIGAGCSKETPKLLDEPIVIDEPIIEEPIDVPIEPVDSIIQVEDSINAKKFIGTWVETYPELYDGTSDTIVFTEDFKIEKHLILQNNIYSVEKDTLFFYNTERGVKLKYQFTFLNEKEIYFPDFIQNRTSTNDKPTHFTKIDNL